jgi:hypothetical protein
MYKGVLEIEIGDFQIKDHGTIIIHCEKKFMWLTSYTIKEMMFKI